MKPKKSIDNKMKQILSTAGPYLDVIGPILSGLWIAISFIPVIIPLINFGGIPEITILQAFLISELGILFSRQTISFTSWLSDTTGAIDRIKKNDDIANTLRGLQLTLLLISFFLTSFNFLLSTMPTAIKVWTTLSTTLTLFAKSPVILLIAEITKYAPIVGAVAGVLGVSYYLYQAYQATNDIKRYQAKIDELESNYPEYTELYQNILKPKANVQALCKGLPRTAEHYLFLKHFNETKKQESQKTRRDFLFWAGICAVGLGITLVGAIATLTPLGPMVIAGVVTVSMIAKIAAVISLLAVSAAITGYHLNNKFYCPEKKQNQLNNLECALKTIETTSHQDISRPIQPIITCVKTPAQGQTQPTPLAVSINPAAHTVKKAAHCYKPGFFQLPAKDPSASAESANLANAPTAKPFKQ